MAIKAILLDIDGTLTNHNKEITPETRRVLMKAETYGIRLVIASGRPSRGIFKYGDQLDMADGSQIQWLTDTGSGQQITCQQVIRTFVCRDLSIANDDDAVDITVQDIFQTVLNDDDSHILVFADLIDQGNCFLAGRWIKVR